LHCKRKLPESRRGKRPGGLEIPRESPGIKKGEVEEMRLDDIASETVSKGIMALRATNPAGWAAFKASLKAVAVGAGSLSQAMEDDKLSADEIQGAIGMVQDYGAARTLQDAIWGIMKHIKR